MGEFFWVLDSGQGRKKKSKKKGYGNSPSPVSKEFLKGMMSDSKSKSAPGKITVAAKAGLTPVPMKEAALTKEVEVEIATPKVVEEDSVQRTETNMLLDPVPTRGDDSVAGKGKEILSTANTEYVTSESESQSLGEEAMKLMKNLYLMRMILLEKKQIIQGRLMHPKSLIFCEK